MFQDPLSVYSITNIPLQFFLVAVTCLTSAVVYICYWIGFPYWMNKSPVMTVILMIIGHWLLINVTFHYYMAAFTPVGVPPNKEVYEAVSICKKCISPKPPRTHHCSVCNKCVLNMVSKFNVTN